MFKFVNFVVGECFDENIVDIADVYLEFSFYCIKYFVFDVGHVEFRYIRTKRWPHRNPVNLYIYVAGGIIEWDFCGTGKEKFFEDFWLYSWRGNWGVILVTFYYYFYGFVNWNVNKKVFDIEWCRYAIVGRGVKSLRFIWIHVLIWCCIYLGYMVLLYRWQFLIYGIQDLVCFGFMT